MPLSQYQSQDGDDTVDHLRDALEETDCERTAYHIRQALQLCYAGANDDG